MSKKDSTSHFETPSIDAEEDELEEEEDEAWLRGQKKTFTAWINSHLRKEGTGVEDLYTDLADGRKLVKLLERISGEKLQQPSGGNTRLDKIANVKISLEFLRSKIKLESISAEEIVDGNPSAISKLIWVVISRFAVQDA